MRDTRISTRYAKALELLVDKRAARENAPRIGLLERTLEDLAGFAEVVRPGTRVGDFLRHPKVRPDDKRTVLRKALTGRAVPDVVVFADLLLRKKRLVLATAIAREFETLVERARGVQRAEVVSAVPLVPAELERLHRELERTTDKKIKLAARVDPALVGGAYVRIGDRIVDRSVKTLLETIANRLYEVSV